VFFEERAAPFFETAIDDIFGFDLIPSASVREISVDNPELRVFSIHDKRRRL
jgi:hypothetical protein